MTQTIQLNQDKINEGRLLATLRQEDKVLSCDAQEKLSSTASTSLLERIIDQASLVKGIIQGNLEIGEWERALELVYTNKKVQELFYDGWEWLINEVIESARKQSQEYSLDFEYNCYNIVGHKILKCWKPEDIVRLIVETPMQVQTAQKLFNSLPEKIQKERKLQVYNALGERCLAKRDFSSAKHFFRRVDNKERVEETYTVAFETMNCFSDVRYLLSFVDEFSVDEFSDAKERRKKIIRKTLDTLSDDEYALSQLWDLLELREMNLSEQERTKIKEAYASRLEYTIILRQKCSQEMSLIWAKYNASKWDYAELAYQIMRTVNYRGEKRKAATKMMLHRNKIKEIEKQDLLAIRDESDLETRTEIAVHLDDKQQMLKLSREYAEELNKPNTEPNTIDTQIKNLHFRTAAYSLWITGGGDENSEFVNALRNKLIEEDTKDKTNISYHGICRWLKSADKKGLEQVFEIALAKDSHTAYSLAKQFKDDKKIQKARERMIAESPQKALQAFSYSFTQQSDDVGIELAVDALSKKYSLPAERVREIITR